MDVKAGLKFFNIKFVIPMVAFLLLTASAKPAKCDINAWPFLEATDETTTVLYPFYVNEEDFKMMFPLYYNTNNGKDHHLVWPLFKISDGGLKRFAPFWFSEAEESFTFFPFIRQTPEYTLWTIPPVYFEHDSDFFAMFPLYLKNNEKKFIFPNIYMKKSNNADELERFVLFPLYFYKNRHETKKINLAFLYGNEWSENLSHSWLLPVYEKKNTPNEKKLWLFPYYSKNTPKDDIKAVFPFYYNGKEQTLLGETERTVWSLWPIYSKKETLSDEGSVIERKRRFLIFSDNLNRNGIRQMRVFGIPVRETFSAGMKNSNKHMDS